MMQQLDRILAPRSDDVGFDMLKSINDFINYAVIIQFGEPQSRSYCGSPKFSPLVGNLINKKRSSLCRFSVIFPPFQQIQALSG